MRYLYQFNQNMKIPNRLETERLIIRPFELRDLDLFYAFMSNEKATQYLLFSPEQKTYEGAKKLLEDTINSYNNPQPLFALTIADRNRDLFLGSCGFAPLEKQGEVQCYYAIDPKYWRQGLATEAFTKLIEYAFLELKLSKIVSFVNPENIASIKLAEKVGMKYEEKVKRKDFGDREGLVFEITIENYQK